MTLEPRPLHIVVTGGAGFIGSHLTDRLLDAGHAVTAIDNFVRGRTDNLRAAFRSARFQLIEGDLSTETGAVIAFESAHRRGSIDMVWHMAANSDIPAGIADPSIDLRDTFLTTFYTLAAMRRLDILELAFASTSAVYGVHVRPLTEDSGPLFPISNYGAMKLASEGIISASVESFLSRAYVFRFPNVIGSRATHGIVLDLIRKLQGSTAFLEVLGDGTQQKPYLHVSELIDAMVLITECSHGRLNCFNIAGSDDGATVQQIAEAVVRVAAPGTPIRYTGGCRGWVGDVPRFKYSINKLLELGWCPQLSSREAIERAVREVYEEVTPCKS